MKKPVPRIGLKLKIAKQIHFSNAKSDQNKGDKLQIVATNF